MENPFMYWFSCAADASQPDYLLQKQEQSKEYKEWKCRSQQVTQEIRDKLGDEKRLLRRLEAVENACIGLEEDWVYEKGFQDCFRLLKWMGAFSK